MVVMGLRSLVRISFTPVWGSGSVPVKCFSSLRPLPLLRRLENDTLRLASLSKKSNEGKTFKFNIPCCHQIQSKLAMSTTAASPASENGSLCRQNYHAECEALVNKQLNMELYASHVYMSMAYYFDREDVALEGFYKFFKKASDEEREHAELLMKFQNNRGGQILLESIPKPKQDKWDGPLEAITVALELEKTVNQMLLDMYSVAETKSDAHLCDFIEEHFLEEQVKAIKELSDHITNLKRVGKGLGEYIFDKDLKA